MVRGGSSADPILIALQQLAHQMMTIGCCCSQVHLVNDTLQDGEEVREDALRDECPGVHYITASAGHEDVPAVSNGARGAGSAIDWVGVVEW